MISFVEKTKGELDAWFPTMWEEYYRDVLASGQSEAAAAKNVKDNQERLYPGGELASDQHIMNVLDGGVAVGTLWLGEPRLEGTHDWFIYDIVIDEHLRGQGYGRRTMEAAQEWVRARGATRLSLNVFGPNEVARGLYDSLGFTVMATTMFKEL